MPYRIEKKDNKFCVYNTDTGDKKGEFDTRPEAMKQMKALYAAENNSGKTKDTKKKPVQDGEQPGY